MTSSTSRALYVDAICDMGKYFVKNVDTFTRGCLVNDERRIDTDIGVIRHGDETAFHGFLEDDLTGFLVELFVGFAVLHQLQTDEQTLTTHITDEWILVLHGIQFVHHERSDLLGIFNEAIFKNGPHSDEGRSCSKRIAAIT